MKNLKNKKGITLVALVITVVVLLIIVAIVIKELNDNGIIEKAKEAKYEQEVAQIKEKIDLACNGKAIDKHIEDLTNDEFFSKIEEELKEEKEFKNATFSYGNNAEEMLMLIQLSDGKWYEYEITTSGIKNSEEVLCLDIADGNIELKSTGYLQGTNELTEHSGKYILTGTTTEYIVKISGTGDFNITFMNLNIDVSGIDGLCAFNANSSSKATDLNVNILLLGENILKSSDGAGLNFSKATANINGVTNGSTLTIQGTGILKATGGGYAASGIGSSYTSFLGDVNNITINSGTIIATAKGTMVAAIGTYCTKNCNNIIINGGNIKANASNYYGIGGKIANNIIINSGNITAYGGAYGGAIGGDTGSDIVINGGKIIARAGSSYPAIGFSSNNNTLDGKIEINGGTITALSSSGSTGAKYYGQYAIQSSTGNITINGGTIFAIGKEGVIGKYNTGTTAWEEANPTTSNVTLKQYTIPTNNKRVTVTKVMIGEEILYDTSIGALCTREDGKIDIYVPIGDTRTITVEANGQTYTF